MRQKFPDLDLVLIESGGDNLAATFSPELADITIYVIDVAAGEKIPSKGGPGITRSDLLVINKVDLAPYVGASLEVMQRDAKKMRGARPFVMSNLKTGDGIAVEAALHAYLHAITANLISAGVRLVPLGQTDGLRILAALESVVAATAQRALTTKLDDVSSTALRADLASLHHETQYTRLFRS